MADQNGAPDGTHRRSSRTRRPVKRAPKDLKRGQKFQRALAECRELRVAWADEHTVGRKHKKRRREVYEKHGLDRYQWSQCYNAYRKKFPAAVAVQQQQDYGDEPDQAGSRHGTARRPAGA